jgi:hypothetical protein
MDDAYFTERPDCCGRMSASTDHKMTIALRQICSGLPADGPIAEYCRTNESTNNDCLKRFSSPVADLFEDEWLRDRLGFPGRKQLPPFSDPSKSKGLRGLHSLSVYGRSAKKEGFLR